MFKKVIPAVFFGNYFYGLCAVALSIEASLQQRYPLNGPVWYVLLFSALVVYYTYAYISETSVHAPNKRTNWYINNRQGTMVSMLICTATAYVAAIYLLCQHGGNIWHIQAWQWAAISIFPAVAILYYGVPYKHLELYNLRRTGWLKPFLIGFVWAGSTTIYPLVFFQVETGLHYTFSYMALLLFIKNFMFISVLGIMFDIKDYASDYNQQLKTFVVQVGLRKTIFYIIIPLSALGFVSFLAFAFTNHFNTLRVCFNAIPFMLLLLVAYSMHRRKSILYYLMVIDGLMLVKAVCGILGMLVVMP